MKNIALLCGFETAEQAEEHRKKIRNADKYEVATLYSQDGKTEMGSFVISSSVADMIMNMHQFHKNDDDWKRTREYCS